MATVDHYHIGKTCVFTANLVNTEVSITQKRTVQFAYRKKGEAWQEFENSPYIDTNGNVSIDHVFTTEYADTEVEVASYLNDPDTDGQLLQLKVVSRCFCDRDLDTEDVKRTIIALEAEDSYTQVLQAKDQFTLPDAVKISVLTEGYNKLFDRFKVTQCATKIELISKIYATLDQEDTNTPVFDQKDKVLEQLSTLPVFERTSAAAHIHTADCGCEQRFEVTKGLEWTTQLDNALGIKDSRMGVAVKDLNPTLEGATVVPDTTAKKEDVKTGQGSIVFINNQGEKLAVIIIATTSEQHTIRVDTDYSLINNIHIKGINIVDPVAIAKQLGQVNLDAVGVSIEYSGVMGGGLTTGFDFVYFLNGDDKGKLYGYKKIGGAVGLSSEIGVSVFGSMFNVEASDEFFDAEGFGGTYNGYDEGIGAIGGSFSWSNEKETAEVYYSDDREENKRTWISYGLGTGIMGYNVGVKFFSGTSYLMNSEQPLLELEPSVKQNIKPDIKNKL